MQNQDVITDSQRKIRKRNLVEKDKKEAKEEIEGKKNNNFTQVYPLGWQRLLDLAKGNPGAFELYTFFAQNIDISCGAVVCDQAFLAEKMSVSTRTIRRWLDYLEDERALVRIPVAGKVCAYALNPHEVWKGYDTSKNYAAFVTRTLVNKNGEIQRRIKAMFSSKK